MALLSGLLTADQSSLLDLNPYTLAAGWSVSNGVATKVATSGTATLTVTVPIISGRTYALMINMIGGDPGGVIGPFFGGPFGGIATSNTNASAPHVWLMTAEQDHTVIQIGANAQFTGSISDIQVRDVTDALSRPAVIVGVWGQSPFAVEDSAEQIDNDLDGWTDDRLYYYAGSTNAGYQAVAGEIAPLTAALQQAQNADGVSPAIAYAQNLLSLIPDGFNLLLVPYARGGTTLYGAGAGWAVGGAQYTQFITNMQAAKALNGQNTHLAIIGGQGQSNLTETVDQDWPAAWSAVLTQMRADLSEPELGSYLLGPPPDVDATQIALLIEGQTATDADSGDPRSIANNYFVPFPAGYVEADGVHANAEGNRLGGAALAARHVEIATSSDQTEPSVTNASSNGFDYLRARSTAERLISRFGQAGSLIKPGANTGPPSAPVIGQDQLYAVTLVALDYDDREIDGSLIRVGDRRVIVSTSGLTVTPNQSDRIRIGTDPDNRGLEIVSLSPLTPGGVVVLYQAQVRG